MRRALITVALALLLIPTQAQASTITIVPPFVCSASTGGAVHSVCGMVGFGGTLVKGQFQLLVTIPYAMRFPKGQYVVQLSSEGDILWPPVTCKYTAQPLSRTAFLIVGVGCSSTKFAVAYMITGR